MQTLLQCLYSRHVQLLTFTSVRMLKIPSIGSHAFVCTHQILHALLGIGGAALAAAVALPS